jgi:hypothetical protein
MDLPPSRDAASDLDHDEVNAMIFDQRKGMGAAGVGATPRVSRSLTRHL